jgi:hypothetical protein
MQPQKIKEITENNYGMPLVFVTGGRSNMLTKANIEAICKVIKIWIDTPRHYASGVKYSGNYYQRVNVIGDGWSDTITIRIIEI